jgi:hypothetical protein
MVEKFKTILKEIKSSKGEVELFALMRMDELPDKWSIILSAPWAKEGDLEVFKDILNLIKLNLSQEELSTIARISIFPRTDHFIEELLSKYTSGASISNEKINGNQIHEGYILDSNPNLKLITK